MSNITNESLLNAYYERAEELGVNLNKVLKKPINEYTLTDLIELLEKAIEEKLEAK